MRINTYAKVNITLDIIDKRSDGYHNVEMIMQAISLSDDIEIQKSKEISIWCDKPYIPQNHTNLAYKAAAAFFKRTGITGGADIRITKRIPSGAGLGGGSSNAAGVITALNELYNTGLSTAQCMEVGKKIGADVPFFMLGGTCLAQGIGERLSPLPNMPKCHIVLAKPAFSVSTKWVYQNLDLSKINNRPDTNAVIESIKKGNLKAIATGMSNVLESVTSEKYSDIEKYKSEMTRLGALGSIMSGSGSTVFGIFDDMVVAENCAKIMMGYTNDVFVCDTV